MIYDVITFAVAFALAFALYPPSIRVLRRIKVRQVIQSELPDSHQKKSGTPTAGGVVFVVLGIIAGALAALAGHQGAGPAAAGLGVGFIIGAFDDGTKLRMGAVGIPARLKFPVEVVLAAPVVWVALAEGGMHQLWLPSSPWLLFAIALVAVVGTVNAVNVTDGIDGLAGGVSVIAIGALVLLMPHARAGEKAVAMALCGALVAFLVFNRHPARVFMGDTGSLAIGFALAAMAIQQGLLILLPLLGLVFVLETLSVIIQVAYFKASGGRRVFKMTPIHYTFLHEGWSENRIALTFWSAGLLSALAAAGVARLAT